MIQEFRPVATLETLRERAAIIKKIRIFFEELGFLEVETPILSADTVVDRHLDPMELGLNGKRYFLQTSPEFAMKRLVAAFPDTPIFQICKVFRQDECGEIHNPEFTMLEFYRPGDDLARGIALLDELQNAVLGRGTAERATYGEVFERYLNLAPLTAQVPDLAEVARKSGCVIPEGFDDSKDGNPDDWLDFLLGEKIQPRLGFGRPLILTHFPASQAALAVSDGRTAERFELYVDGIELANGYHELCDAHELRRRNRIANALRRMDGKSILPDESRLLSAMDFGLPPCAGTAVGLDRLLMLALGKTRLEDVLAFPFGEA